MSTALVQGASRGIGASFVKSILNRTDHNVIATARNPDMAKSFIQNIIKPSQLSRVTFLELDVQKESTIASTAEFIKQSGQKLSLYINSAGFLQAEKSLRAVDRENLIKHMEINAIGPLLCAKAFAPLMLNSGKIVFISARTGSIQDNVLGGWYSYRMSKAALNMGARTLSLEVGRKGMTVIALHPGTVDTEFSKDFIKNVKNGNYFSADESAENMFTVIERLTPEDNGTFLDFAGEPITW